MMQMIRDYMQKLTPDKLSALLACMLLSAVGFVAVVGLFYLICCGWSDGVLQARFGAVGDFFGGIFGAIFGFLSLLAILLTLVLQSRELEETREELRQSRIAHEGQLAELKAQVSFAERREKRDLVFRMLERWSSPAMRELRVKAWEAMEHHFYRALNREGFKINLFHFRQSNKPQFDLIMEVLVFLSELEKLLEEGLLDRELTRLLFADAVVPWFKYLDRVETAAQETVDHNYEACLGPWVAGWAAPLKANIHRGPGELK